MRADGVAWLLRKVRVAEQGTINTQLRFEEDHVRKRGQKTGRPCDSSSRNAKGACPRFKGINRMHYGQITVDAHQTDEKDPAVKGDVVNAEDHLAHCIAKMPLVSGLVGEEGERAYQEKVSDGQVEQAHISHATESSPTSDYPDH